MYYATKPSEIKLDPDPDRPDQAPQTQNGLARCGPVCLDKGFQRRVLD